MKTLLNGLRLERDDTFHGACKAGGPDQIRQDKHNELVDVVNKRVDDAIAFLAEDERLRKEWNKNSINNLFEQW